MVLFISSPLPTPRRPRLHSSPLRCSLSLTSSQLSQYENYLRNIAKAAPPPYLDGLLNTLLHQGEQLHPPSYRTNLHPFFIPLTKSSPTTFTGLLRWPTPPEDLPLPVVRTASNQPFLKLLAPCSQSYITRQLANADFCGRTKDAVAIRKGCSLALAYQDGDVEKQGLGMERYLALKVGPFPDVYRGFANFHLAKNDHSSALVTCERANRAFAGWASSHCFHATMLQKMGRELEARDAARFCLTLPLWTLESEEELDQMRILAGYEQRESLTKIYERLYRDERKEDLQAGKGKEQIAMDRAAFLLDYWTLGGALEDLGALYEEAGMTDLATFVRY